MSTSSEHLLERVRAAIHDEYVVEGLLGRGGMAAVFLARDIALDRRVAIKVMLPDLMDVDGIQDRFVIEARTAANLDHPGIVSVHAVKEREGLLFIVMKYIEGRTLEQILQTQPLLDPVVVSRIVSCVAEALQFAHAEGIVHRDVKPSNIIMDTRGRPVVTDFGIAKVTSARSITVTGTMLGTPAYMSPEQCRGLTANAMSDQYSLGVMAYEMLAGRVPFTGSIFEMIIAHSSEPPQPIRSRVPDVDPVLEETVMRMLAKNPDERWPSLNDVAQRLALHASTHARADELRGFLSGFGSGAATSTDANAPLFDISPTSSNVATTPTPTPTPHSRIFDTPLPSPEARSQFAPPHDQEPRHDLDTRSRHEAPSALLGGISVILDPHDAPVRTPPFGRVLVAGALLIAIAFAVFLVSQRGATRSTPSSAAAPAVTSSAAPASTNDTAQAAIARTDSLRGDSLRRASGQADSVHRDPQRADAARRPAAIARSSHRPDSSATMPRAAKTVDTLALRTPTPASIRARCRRLIELVSLGELLTPSQSAFVKSNCRN